MQVRGGMMVKSPAPHIAFGVACAGGISVVAESRRRVSADRKMWSGRGVKARLCMQVGQENEDTGRARSTETALERARVAVGSCVRIADEYLTARPIRKLTSGAVALLLGFFASTAASTIIGSVADWDPLAAFVLLLWSETLTKAYYKSASPSNALTLLNTFKCGVIFGMCLDALKLAG
ncbi:protein ycf20 [Porphyridium purpureum]|uniref:Uncharacterized protein ycf20 n=1 Tax=Porphyridium purpureum TaxID=35688 RepID=A0A5J4YKU1_PORPP|nr:protein ycf20 [Porphyridium purpureum]|eukprot:POR1489..scf246_12